MQDLSKFNRNHATFLPAISGFYTGMLARQQDRVPAGFEKGVEGMNFLDPDGYFFYDKALYSAGHAYLNLEKSIEREEMVWTRDRDRTVLVSDSGGFQIGKGVIKFDWENFYEKKGDKNYYVVYRRSDGAHVRSQGLDKGSYRGDIRIDPAPRWNRTNDAILVPGLASDNTRQMFVIRVVESPRSTSSNSAK